MVTIEAKASINNHTIKWLFEAENIRHAVIKAKAQFAANGLAYRTYSVL